LGGNHALGIPCRLRWRCAAKATRFPDDVADLPVHGSLQRYWKRIRGNGGNLDLQVDAVEQRTGDSRPVSGDLIRRAAALVTALAEKAARARVHRRDELEACRETCLSCCPGNVDLPRFERLAQHFEHASIPLRWFVEEKHAVVGKRNLAGSGIAAAADQRHRRRGVMRRAIRTPAPEFRPKTGGERMYCSSLERLVLGQRWQ
jgi:hypothetical protein